MTSGCAIISARVNNHPLSSLWMPSFWVRSAMFFTTAMAFVVALAWKDAVHTLFQAAFPLFKKVDPTTMLQRQSVAMVVYAIMATGLALLAVSALPYQPSAPTPLSRDLQTREDDAR